MTSNKQPVHKKHKSAPEEMACPSRLFATGREELPVRRWRARERIRRGRREADDKRARHSAERKGDTRVDAGSAERPSPVPSDVPG